MEAYNWIIFHEDSEEKTESRTIVCIFLTTTLPSSLFCEENSPKYIRIKSNINCVAMKEYKMKTLVICMLLNIPTSNSFHFAPSSSKILRNHRNLTMLRMEANGQFDERRTIRKLQKMTNDQTVDLHLQHANDKSDIGGDARIQPPIEKFTYLRSATLLLLDTETFPPGSLVKGKWHEMSKMLLAWSKWLNSNAQLTMEDPTEVPLLVESILKRIIDERTAGNSYVQVTTQMYNTILEAWLVSLSKPSKRKRQRHRMDSESGGIGIMHVTVSERALGILKRMQIEYESKGNEDLKPNFFSFITVLKMWTKTCAATSIPSSQKNIPFHLGSRKAHQTLQWMEYLARSGRNDEAKPTVLAYTMVMDAFAKSGEKDAGTKSEALLRHMEREGVKSNLFCYNMVINSYTRQGRRGGAVDNAERILHELEDIYEETSDSAMKPDVITYTSLVTAWANSNRRGFGANRAEEILNRMMTAGCRPNTVTFNAVLKTWCRSAEKNAPERAFNIFKQMEEEYKNGNQRVKPDRITYNTLIHTLAKSGAMEHAQNILVQMESDADPRLRPNAFSYNTIIEGWSKVRGGDGASKAYIVLRKLLTAEKDGRGVRPDSFSFNNVIFALSRSGLKSAALRAEELLQYMEKEYASGNKRLQTDVFGYSAAIHAWASSDDNNAGLRAEKILRELEIRSSSGEKKLKPNSVTYNSCIDCWAKSGQGVYAARRAEQLLERMEIMYKAGNEAVKPTTHTYNGVLQSWAKSNTKCAHSKSLAILNRMWEQYESGDIDLKPDALAYNTVINAISKSDREDKAQKALRILRIMDKLYRAGQNKGARPNEFTYTSVLNSCAFSSFGGQRVRRKALDTAIFTLEELQESSYGRPNHVTYGMFLKACANLIPMDEERRRIVVEPVFLQCCEDGQVGEIVLKQLRMAAPEDLYNKLLGDLSHTGPRVTVEDLPVQWRCNVKNEKNVRRGRRLNEKNIHKMKHNRGKFKPRNP